MGLDFESRYENKLFQEEQGKRKLRELLPIKDTKGFKSVIVEDEEIDTEVPDQGDGAEESDDDYNQAYDELGEDEDDGVPSKKQKLKLQNEIDREKDKGKVFSTANLIAQRRQRQAEYKIKIGVLSASFLEDPEHRVKHLDSLLALLTVKDPAVACTVPKYAALSLLAVFTDVLPAYAIKHHTSAGMKLKHETKELQGFEAQLLNRYKQYLQRLEKMVSQNIPRARKNQNGETDSESFLKLGVVALNCMCKLLASHPYFNMSTNIVNFAVPFLNHWSGDVREVVHNAIKTLFRSDKRGEISYEIVRRINILIKSKMKGTSSGNLRADVLGVLLHLRISEADLEKEKKEEIESSKTKMTHAQRRTLSKKGRKKSKELVKLEKELLEASAEESKTQKSKHLTEISKLVCTIYFRAIKVNSRSHILTGVLEGLAKFAHIISIDYFEDLVRVLQGLLKDEEIKQRDKLLCIATVLSVLSGHGSALALDPVYFHKTLFATLNSLSILSPEGEFTLAIKCIRAAAGRNKLPGPRALAFAKRMTTAATQVAHHDCMAALLELKQLLRLHPIISGLLNTESSNANGIYMSEIDDPDHCGAQASTLWEVSTLTTHYHPWVGQIARSILEPNTSKVQPLPSALAQKKPEDVCQEMYPFETFDFNPAPPKRNVPPPKKARFTNIAFRTDFMQECTSDYVNLSNDVNELEKIEFSS